nr:hypothetical protein [Candidatus Sigynarchaeota archaeon]
MTGQQKAPKTFKMAAVPATLSNHDFMAIGSTITKYTNTMECGLEEQAIGINVPDDDTENNKNPSIKLLETTPSVKIMSSDRLPLIYFQDGIQRTQFVGNVFSDKIKRLVPILFTTVGAVIVKLDGEHILRHLDPIIIEKFITPDPDLLPKEIANAIPKEYLKVVSGFTASMHPNTFRERVLMDEVRALRHETERSIVRQFEKTNPDDWLVLDGPISNFDPGDKRVGIVKRHYLSWIDPDVMFIALKDFVVNNGQRIRSCKFQITYKSRGSMEAIACYTKLLYNFKAGMATNPEFSLIRVETPFKHAASFDGILNTILDMNTPMSNPSDQWDKKIYPILMAEKFLKATAKDDTLIRTAFGGLDFA